MAEDQRPSQGFGSTSRSHTLLAFQRDGFYSGERFMMKRSKAMATAFLLAGWCACPVSADSPGSLEVSAESPESLAVPAESPESIAEEYFAAMQREGLTATVRFMHPDALAEFKTMMLPVYEAEAQAGESSLLSATFGPSSTLATVKESRPEAFMSAVMNLVIAQTGAEQLSFDKIEILGVVPEMDQRHVLTRISAEASGVGFAQIEVLSFLPFEDTWRLQLSLEMRGLAAALLSGM